MNERQRKLAAYLLQAEDYVSQRQIMADLPEYNNERLIRADVRSLNAGSFSYIVVSGDEGYKIANHEEVEEYLDKKRKTAIRMLALAESVRHKLQNNGQLKVNNASNIVEVKTVCQE